MAPRSWLDLRLLAILALILAVVFAVYSISRDDMPFARYLNSVPSPDRLALPRMPTQTSDAPRAAASATIIPSGENSRAPTQAEPEFDPCAAPNAHEVWYRIAPNTRSLQVVKSFYFSAENGRTLLIKQERKMGVNGAPVVQVVASWFDRSNAAETVPKELNNETDFLDANGVLELAGEAWTTGLSNTSPVMEEEVDTLATPDETVTLQNQVAIALKMRFKNQILDCEKKEACRCY